MQTEETILVYVNIVNGRTVCICQRNNKGCRRKCDKDVVTRDKFRGWQEAMQRDRYGK